MSNKTTLEQIANELGVSKATVSKAINNRPGINSETKRAVMQAVSQHGYQAARSNQKLAVIIPSIPVFFWGELRKSLCSHCERAGIICKYYVYPNLNDKKDALNCIDQAIAEGASVLIGSLPDSDEVRKRLEELAPKVLIILTEEFLDISGTFFIGEDSYNEGYTLGKKYMYDFPHSNRFVILHTSEFFAENIRIRGFKSALSDQAEKEVYDISAAFESSTPSANLARELSVLPELPDCILCTSGNLSHAALAVKKLKSEKKIHCIGFDINIENENSKYGDILTHILIQDTDAQAKTAIECASRFLNNGEFPKERCMYIENIRYK